MKLLTLAPILLAVAAPMFATTITASGTNSEWSVNDPTCSSAVPTSNPSCVIGTPSVFGIESATLSVDNSGDVTADILMNFGDSTLTNFTVGGTNLDAADMIITVGSSTYALVLSSHSDGSTTLTGGDLYLVPSTKDAKTVLTNDNGGITPTAEFRDNLPVYGEPTGATLIGTVTAAKVDIITTGDNGTSTGPNAGPLYQIQITDTGATSFYNNVVANGGLSFELASATCGNGVVLGSGKYSCVPEPGTLALMGTALIGLVFVRRRRNRY